MPKIIGIIPARFASTRFPGKPLIQIKGKSMIQRVYEQCLKAEKLAEVMVATDDQRIFEHVQAFGGQVVLTADSHQSGTDRCAEVIRKLERSFDAVINIQGDEPFIEPEQINQVAALLSKPENRIATLIKALEKEEDIRNPNVVKAIRTLKGKAIYFSRSPIPYRRNPEATITYFKHVGIYGYHTDVLLELTLLPQGSLEKAESLEQLRWIEAGYPIAVEETTWETISIDTPADLEYVEKLVKS
ncbi:MAG: 3-deoxy-manno-octulosonate cytidylyltransferase [Bacteroidia bacterium]|jgi:3-deoxy-manno-octulosonate cytidylyltransferase (CMP-KDO synthetase)